MRQSENPSRKRKGLGMGRGQGVLETEISPSGRICKGRAFQRKMMRQDHAGLQANARHRKMRAEVRVASQYVKQN